MPSIRPAINTELTEEAAAKSAIANSEEKYVLNLFEILEDRHSYRGFNSFLFYAFYFFVVYQCMTASTNYNDVAGTKSKLKNQMILPADQMERREFVQWGISKMETFLDDPEYFGDNFEILRITALLEPSGCNNTRDFPNGATGNNPYVVKGVHKHSLAREYENVCNQFEPSEKNKMKIFVANLNENHGIYSHYQDIGFLMYDWGYISVPIYSAEIKPENVSYVREKQLGGLKTVLTGNKNIRLYDVVVDLLDPFTHTLYHVDVWVEQRTVKQFTAKICSVDMNPTNENAALICFIILWVIMQIICTAAEFYDAKSSDNLHRRNSNNGVNSFPATRRNSFRILKNHIRGNKSNLLDLFIILCAWFCIFYMIYMYFLLDVPTGFPLVHGPHSACSIEETTTFSNVNKYDALLWRDIRGQACCSFVLLALTYVLVQELAWHSGASVLTSTLTFAFGDLLDTLFVTLLLLIGFGGVGYGIFGAYAGQHDFNNFLLSVNTIARLSFGLYEYDSYVSDGLGNGYEGLGLATAAYFKYILLWVTFILLSTVIVNILIAVISDGYEIHKDNQRLRHKNNQSFLMYLLHRIIFHSIFQLYPWPTCTGKEPYWVPKMRFTSSKDAKLLLSYCISPKKNVVFDDKLQEIVLDHLVEHKDCRVKENMYTIDLSHAKNGTNLLTIDKDAHIDGTFSTKEKLRFFTEIPSSEALLMVVDTIFRTGNTEEAERLHEEWNHRNLSDKLWNIYKHTETLRKEQKDTQMAGNHVRQVIEPIEREIQVMKTQLKCIATNQKTLEQKIDSLLSMIKKP